MWGIDWLDQDWIDTTLRGAKSRLSPVLEYPYRAQMFSFVFVVVVASRMEFILVNTYSVQ